MARAWYVVQTYSQYEKKVEQEVRELINEGKFKEFILDVKAPIEKIEEVKAGKKRVREKKIWPGYILIELNLPDLGWEPIISEIKKVKGILNFIGANKNEKPLPISDEEVKSVFMLSGELRANKSVFMLYDFTKGEKVKINGGHFDSFAGEILSIDYEKKRVKVEVKVLGKVIPLDVEFEHIEKF